jgi:hypothetical protein
MAEQDRTPVVCTVCGSPRVATMDETGSPLCVLHAALELGGRDGQQSAIFELLEVIGAHVVESGLVEAGDAKRAFTDAIAEGATRREKLQLRPVPTFAFDRVRGGEA